MKTFSLSCICVLALALAAAPAAADDVRGLAPSDGTVQLGPAYGPLCHNAMSLQEKRIHDLRGAIEYDKKVEHDLLEGAAAREADATTKEAHAKQWRDAAANVSGDKQKSFNSFATWLEGEAKTDRAFATERRDAAKLIAKGWHQAAEGIKGHERYLADLRTQCAT